MNRMDYKFFIGAGHSDTDPGAVANGLREADVAVQIRDLVAAKLRAKGILTLTDNSTGRNDPLKTSINLSKLARLSIELHCNAAESPAACGVESISLVGRKKVSQDISRSLARALGTKVRGDNGWIDQAQSARGKLGFVNANGIIVEMFFLTNPAEVAKFKAEGGPNLIADAIVNALIGV